MPVKYEDIYVPFTQLTNDIQKKLISAIRQRRRAFITPKRKSKAKKQEQSSKRTNKNSLKKLIDKLSDEEKMAIIAELEAEND